MIPRFERRLAEVEGMELGGRSERTAWRVDGKTVNSGEGLQLNVIVVGAGIAGFAAAVALRRAGHKVKLIEKASFKREAGYMIAIGPNGSRVLDEFDFDYARGRAVQCDYTMQYDGKTMEPQTTIDGRYAEKMYGSKTWIFYRPDLHAELKRLALDPDSPYPVPELLLGSSVVSADPDSGTIVLADGTCHTADLLVGADGERSSVRQSFRNPGKLQTHPFKTIRTLIPTSTILADPSLTDIMLAKRRQFSMYNDNFNIFSWYEGRDGLLQDCEIAYLIKPDGSDKEIETNPTLLRKRLLHELRNYHPALKKVFELAPMESITDWDVHTLQPLSSFHQGRALVVGDAAHSMLFTTGQGGCQGLEDAGALRVLFARETLPNFAALSRPNGRDVGHLVQDRLRMFDEVRKERAHLMQRLSGIRLGKEKSYFKKFEPELRVKGERMTNTEDHLDWMYRYDVFGESKRVLENEGKTRSLL